MSSFIHHQVIDKIEQIKQTQRQTLIHASHPSSRKKFMHKLHHQAILKHKAIFSHSFVAVIRNDSLYKSV